MNGRRARLQRSPRGARNGFTARRRGFPADCRAVAANANAASTLDSTLRPPRPQRFPQHIDAEVGGGGLGSKGGYDDCPGHPIWLPPREWLGGAHTAQYPLHLLTTQPATRLHGQMDMGVVSQESKIAGREPMRIHPDDARRREIADGDVVRVFNDRGAMLAGAVLSDQVRPGVIQIATGVWFDPIVPGEIGSLDKHGNPNVLTHIETCAGSGGAKRAGRGREIRQAGTAYNCFRSADRQAASAVLKQTASRPGARRPRSRWLRDCS